MFFLQAVFVGTSIALASATPTEQPHCQTVMSMEMPADQFWAIIDATTEHTDQDSQVAALRATLTKLSTEDIVAFDLAFRLQRDRAYSWDLWGAAYVANSGASDDGFEYFLDWLVSRGRVTFEKVLADPDSLIDVVPLDSNMGLEFEAFIYVAGDLWIAKTGKDYASLADIVQKATACKHNRTGPSGTPFKEHPEYLSKRYPKLWKQFGNDLLR